YCMHKIDFHITVIFFFQAEDGIRDFHVTGVQTCALPIFRWAGPVPGWPDAHQLRRLTVSTCGAPGCGRPAQDVLCDGCTTDLARSEERRVGIEGLLWTRQLCFLTE